jgi:hypothetical protein
MSESFNDIGDAELDQSTKKEMQDTLDGFFERPMEKAEEFDWNEFKVNEAFKAIMMPSKMFWVLANFERSFTQKLGSQMYEKFARAIAEGNENHGSAETDHQVPGAQISRAEQRKIESIITELDNGERDPNWQEERQAILDADSDVEKVSVRINWDLWVKDFQDGSALAAEIKTPKPNKDQTMEAKRKMLKTVAASKHREGSQPVVRYVFPFNPYGSREEYNHWAAKKIFDVESGNGMMVAEEFWDALGGENTMEKMSNFLLEESKGNIEKLQKMVEESQDDKNSNLNMFISDE